MLTFDQKLYNNIKENFLVIHQSHSSASNSDRTTDGLLQKESPLDICNTATLITHPLWGSWYWLTCVYHLWSKPGECLRSFGLLYLATLEYMHAHLHQKWTFETWFNVITHNLELWFLQSGLKTCKYCRMQLFHSVTLSSLLSKSNKPLQITRSLLCRSVMHHSLVLVWHCGRLEVLLMRLCCNCSHSFDLVDNYCPSWELYVCVCVSVHTFAVTQMVADSVCHSPCQQSICLHTPLGTVVQSTTAGYYS